MNNDPRIFSPGVILGKSFQLYLNNFVVLFLASFIVKLPANIFTLWGYSSGVFNFNELTNNRGAAMFIFSNMFISAVFEVIASGIIILIISERFWGRQVDIQKIVRSSFTYIGSLFALAVMLVGLHAMGFMVMVVPGIIIAIGLSCAVPVLVLEKTSVFNALFGSWQLTRGLKIHLAGVLAGVVGIVMGINILFQGGVAGIAKEILPENPMFLEVILATIINDGSTPFMACVGVVIYFTIKKLRETAEQNKAADGEDLQ